MNHLYVGITLGVFAVGCIVVAADYFKRANYTPVYVWAAAGLAGLGGAAYFILS